LESLHELILQLISKKQEDTYWDFKQEWHKNNAALLHDIICLANAEYKGDRLLILGISDPPACDIVGIQSDPNRKTQSDLIDFLSKVKFAGDLRPTISLKKLLLLENEIDIILIQDIKQKPFTLSEQYRDGKTYLHAGSIYTRVGDRNTATDKTADLYFSERMWRERFGLDITPLDRINKYLLDYSSWQWDGIATGYYKYFPEFTIVCGDGEKIENNEHWWHRWPLDEPSQRLQYQLKFHNTTLEQKKVIHFDRESFSIPFPEIEYIQIDKSKPNDAVNTYCFYYFEEPTLRFSLLVHLFSPHFNENILQKIKQEKFLCSPSKPPLGFLPFPIFSCSQEKGEFLQEINKNMNIFLEINPSFPCGQLGKNKQAEEKVFSFWAYDLFWKWKNI
jgi:hypothetical protein